MNRLIAAGALIALIAPGAAVAQNAPAPAVQVTTGQTSNPVICRYYYYNGQIIRKQVCLTAHEWERMRYVTQRNLIRFQIQALSSD